jgi:hypothetical protein
MGVRDYYYVLGIGVKVAGLFTISNLTGALDVVCQAATNNVSSLRDSELSHPY